MNESLPPFHFRRHICHTKEILEAYIATAQGIRVALAQAEKDEPLTMHRAAVIADRIREGRDLIHQVLTRRKHHKRMRQMMRIHLMQRDRLLSLAEKAGLAVGILKPRCKIFSGSSTLD